MFEPIILDDAGQRVPLVRFNHQRLPFLYIGPLPREVQRAMFSAMVTENGKPKIFFSRQSIVRKAWIGVVPLVFVVGVILLNRFGWLDWRVLYPVLMLLFCVQPAYFYAIFPLSLTDDVRKLCADIAVFAGHCGSCGYLLTEIPDTDNGLCRCSECGACWARPKPFSQV